MFDLRYHVASLAAVFVAIVLGIFIGVGLSGKGFVSDAERENLQARIDELRVERDDAVALAEDARRQGEGLDDYARSTYQELVDGRLDGKRVGVVFVGSVDQGVAGTIRRAVSDASGRITMTRALRVPLDGEGVDGALRSDPDLQDLAGLDNRDRLGRELARELVAAGPNPVLDAVARTVVLEQTGSASAPLDAVVVARSAAPQQGGTQEFLAGLYSGLAAAPLPTAGVEKTNTRASAVPAFHVRGLSTVDSVDTPAGQVALVFLLAGARAGSYGVDADAADGVLPVPPPRPATGGG